MLTPTSRIANTLKEMAMRKYVNMVNRYLLLVRQKQALGQHYRQQERLESFGFGSGISRAGTERELLRQKRQALRDAKICRSRAEIASQASINLGSLGGIGLKKLDLFEGIGISTGQDLLAVYEKRFVDHERYHRMCNLFQRTKAESIIERYVVKIRKVLRDATNSLATESLNVEALEAEVAILEGEAAAGSNIQNSGGAGRNDPLPESTRESQLAVTEFSSFEDHEGYNGRFFSKYLIECVQHSNFQQIKPGIVHRMYGLGGRLLSIDFQYKSVNRIVVFADGKPFHPWKSLCFVMNELGQVVWWGALKGRESITEIKPHLERLNTRLCRLQGPVRIIWVDDCCRYRKKLQEIFGPDVRVKLDHWHWHDRWSDIIRDKKSERYAIFRSLMSRAILHAAPEEFNRKKNELKEKLKQTPTIRRILRDCKTTTPSPKDITTSVTAIIEYFLLEDARAITEYSRAKAVAAISSNIATEDANASELPIGTHQESGMQEAHIERAQLEPPKLFFKDTLLVRRKLDEQLKHAECIADEAGIALHQQKKNGSYFCCRGNGKNERFNRKVNETVLCYGNIAVGRADRGIWTVTDEQNRYADCVRQGATQYNTSNIESLALANSLAQQVGCVTLPFKDVSLPTIEHPEKERSGFELDGDQEYQLDIEDTESFEDAGSNLNEEHVEEDVIDVDDDDDEPLYADPERVHEAVYNITRLIAVACATAVSKNETSLQMFTRMTGNSPWLPFSDDDDETSREERRLFEEKHARYSRSASKSAPNGYNAFSDEWDRETALRIAARLKGEEAILIYRKTANQLAEYYDRLADRKRLASQATTEGKRRLKSINQVLKNARQRIQEPPVLEKRPTQYPQAGPGDQAYLPLGVPLTLDTARAFPSGSVMVNQHSGGAAPFLLQSSVPQVVQNLSVGYGSRIFRRVCKKCGRGKQEHPNCTTSFGERNCPFNHCGRCGYDISYHCGFPMGIGCQFTHGLHDMVLYDRKIEALLDKEN
jgi:hypothetical protein